MKHKAFTEIIAHSCNIPQKTVALFARNLKEAGLLTTGARGVNAPEMTELDLARMLITLCATDRPNEAVEMSNLYRHAASRSDAVLDIHGTKVDIPKGEELEDLLSELLKLPYNYIEDLGISLSINWNRLEVELVIKGVSISFFATGEPVDGLTTVRSIGGNKIDSMVLPFFLEREDDQSWENMTATNTAGRAYLRHVMGVKEEGGADG